MPETDRRSGVRPSRALLITWADNNQRPGLRLMLCQPPIIEPCIIQPPQLSWPVQLAMWLVIQVTIELHQLCGVVVDPRGFAIIHCSQVASM